MQIANLTELDEAPVGTLARHPTGVLVHVAKRDDGARFYYVNAIRKLAWSDDDFPLVVLWHPEHGPVAEPGTPREAIHMTLVDHDPDHPANPALIRDLVNLLASR